MWLGAVKAINNCAQHLQFWQPALVQELAVRKNSGPWVVLGSGLQREFHVTSAKRRMSQVQATQFKSSALK
jgi:hypothetical protein